MAPYQTFPGTPGNSQSIEKLRLLRLPELGGKHFLDVGCNEGFFCGFAKFENAACVVGLDRCGNSIQKARKRFPGCEFLEQGWEELPTGPFDVILLASSLHYANDQEGLIHNLMERLSADGILVLELGIGPKGRGEWVEVKSGTQKRFFPTWAKLEDMLEPYAWKNFGPSVCKKGHPERYIVHVRRRKPIAYFLVELPAAARAHISANLFRAVGIEPLSDDKPRNYAEDAHAGSSIELMVKAYIEQAKGKDFAVSVQSAQFATFYDCIVEKGYMPIAFAWHEASPSKGESTGSNAESENEASRVDYPRKPLAYLLMQPPAYGKTTIAKQLFKPAGIQIVSGDETISAVAKGRLAAPSQLTEAIRSKFSPLTINESTHQVLDAGLVEGLVKLYMGQSKGQDFVLDAYVPMEFHTTFSKLIAVEGYSPVMLKWNRVGVPLPPAQKMVERANAYFTHLGAATENSNSDRLGASLPFRGTTGFVERVALEREGHMTIRGWALHETGEMPSVFRIVLQQREIPIISLTKQSRPDVQRHFQLPHALFGYIVTTRAVEEAKVSDVRGEIHVFAGLTPEKLDGPFRHARTSKR